MLEQDKEDIEKVTNKRFLFLMLLFLMLELFHLLAQRFCSHQVSKVLWVINYSYVQQNVKSPWL